jgi:two-component system sensor histidine kinase KdpD
MEPMTGEHGLDPSRGRWRGALEGLAALGAASVLAWFLEDSLDIRNASSVYLLAVAAIAIRWGTGYAIATALAAVVTYNFLFVEPRFSFLVGGAEELFTLLLLLFAGIVIGRLAGQQRDRARQAARSEREARALFAISRELATAGNVSGALAPVLSRLALETNMARVWVGIGPTKAQERVAADSAAGTPLPPIGTHAVLSRDHAEGIVAWARIHPAATTQAREEGARAATHGQIYRVEVRGGSEIVGSLWAERHATSGDPPLDESRLLAATAEQLGQALHRERLVAQAADLEVARRSDDLKSALLDSVSHDLRTPLATIRATAGSLADSEIDLTDAEQRAAATAIDREAERLNRLVGDLLDMSRIQAGALVPQIDVIPLDELVQPAIDRLRARLAGHRLSVEIPAELPSVRADAVLLDQVVSNLLENAIKHAGDGAPIRVSASAASDGVRLVIEDGGRGVPDSSLPHLFDRFHRVSTADGPRPGFGLGLAVVRGLIEAMGGSVVAARGQLGGLAVTVTLPIEPGRHTP